MGGDVVWEGYRVGFEGLDVVLDFCHWLVDLLVFGKVS